MLNLAYPLDDTVEIDGLTHDIDLSFDNVLRLIDMVNDEEIEDQTKIVAGIEMFLGIKLDYDMETQSEIFIELFNSTVGSEAENSRPVDIDGNPMPDQSESEEKVYSIKEDADYIFASFYQDYGIDLYEMHGRLHWLKFKALLGGLRKDTRFKEIIEIRQMELPTGKGSGKQREQIKKMQRQYALKGDD